MLNILKQNNFKNLFNFIIIFKFLLLGFFSSELSSDLFFPFTNQFNQGNYNPWDFYEKNNLNPEAFPYHALMLYIHIIPSLLSSLIENVFLSNLLFKMPLLISDFIIYKLLCLLYENKKRIIIFYFLNPVIIYSTYIHSQLDIIPMSLLMISIYYLTRNKFTLSLSFIGLALATKLHMLAVLPLIIFYISKKYDLSKVLSYSLIPFIVVLLVDLPFFLNDGFQQMVLFNEKQNLLFNSFIEIGSQKIYIPILAVVLIYFHFYNLRKVNTDLLNFYIGLLFSSLIFFIYPSPGWYVWIVPFISIYFISSKKNINKILIIHLVFSFTYLAYFLFFYKSDYIDILFLKNEINLSIDNKFWINIVYTMLQGTLLIILFAFYKYGIISNSLYNKQSNILIGVGGDSGVGKTSLVKELSNLFKNNFLAIEGDGDHKWERGNKKWKTFTHLDPKANNIYNTANALSLLKNNKSCLRSDYNHENGKFTTPKKIIPKEFIAISGLHPFYLPLLRNLMDFKIFIDTEEKLRIHWKLTRDLEKRNHSLDKILEQIKSREQDTIKYIRPQKKFSDLIIKFYSLGKFKVGDKSKRINLGLKLSFDSNISLDKLFNQIDDEIDWHYNDDLSTQSISFKAEPKIDFTNLAYKNIPNLKDIIDYDVKLTDGYYGLIQFVSLLIISNKLKFTTNEV